MRWIKFCQGTECKCFDRMDCCLVYACQSKRGEVRLADIVAGRGLSAKAHEKLRWQAKYGMKDVVRMMVEVERK